MTTKGPEDKGLIATFARHRTAPNLLMVAMIIGGLFALMRLNTQFFPDIGLDVVSVSVAWPGASAEDVDANIVQAIEPEIRFLDGVKHVTSRSVEGSASISLEFEDGTDMQAALSDVETAIGQVTTLPEESESPIVRRLVRYDTISRLVVSGPYPEPALKAFAKRIRDDLLDRGVDKVDLVGARDEEIWVQVRPETLRRLDLTLADISQRIDELSRDLPSGVTQGGSERQVRSIGQVKTARGLADLEVVARDNGEKVRLSDIALVQERFDDSQATVRYGGQPAIELHIQRSVNADALKVADLVDRYLAEVRPQLPQNLTLSQYNILADLIRSRINLLLENGAGGLVLVLAILFLFLNARVAFWVAVGIPVSLLATLLIMLASGQSINMVSLFGLIMAIGIVVDDAIVVGEHAEARRRAGLPPLEAAELGAKRMLVPVMASSLTTIAAFMPLFLVSDVIGQIIGAIPLVSVAVILASLVECFFVLPGHMRHALKGPAVGAGKFRQRFDAAFDRFRNGPFRRLVTAAVTRHYLTIAIAVATFIVSVGLVIGGRVGFQFFQPPEADRLYANLQMVAGTPREETRAMLDEMQRALDVVDPDGTVVLHAVTRIGASAGGTGGSGVTGDTVGGIIVELLDSDVRTMRTAEFTAKWEAEITPRAGVETLTVTPAQAGPPGRDVDVRVTGSDVAALKAAAGEIADLLARYPGVSAIQDDLPYGREEAVLTVTPRGLALGFTTQTVGRQVRDAFEGGIAQRFPRDDEEVVVRVMFDRGAAGLSALSDLYLRSSDGHEVPLSEVVEVTTQAGFARVPREDGKRQATVTAELDKGSTSTSRVIAALQRDGIDEIASRNGVGIRFAGRAEEQGRTFADMRMGAGIGLAAIYIILAWVFSSYTRPLVVMSVIPLGFVGATFGHWVMGYDLTVLSMVALIGLSGIVVNDSIILVSTIDERVRRGEAARAAIIDGACDRLRAVILTSATTIGGLTPLMFETSLQAKFLIPMAVTIVFGLLVATLLVLLMVPALLAVQADIVALFSRRQAAKRATPAVTP